MRELELLDHIYRRSSDLHGVEGVEVGPGDDCAVVCFGTQRVLITTDQLVSGRHYDPGRVSADQIARKAVARSVSDIAAMAGEPRFAVATGAMGPDCPEPDRLFDAMSRWAKHWNCPLVGGDIASTNGPTVLTVTVCGVPHASRGPVLRSSAQTGDVAFVTGRLGGSLLSGRHLSFEPRLAEARWLADALGGELHALIDLSDGLGLDADRVARASRLEIDIDAAAIPKSESSSDWRAAASEGEDYELLILVSSAAASGLPERCPPTGTLITRIGVAREGTGAFVIDEHGTRVVARELGWEHRS